MKQLALALALALALTGTLTACGRTDRVRDTDPMTGSSVTGRMSKRSAQDRTGGAWDYLDDARYTAGSNGKVYGGDGNTVTRDLTQGARDVVRGAEDAARDIGRGVGDAARDIGSGMDRTGKDLDRDMTGKY